MKEKGTLCAEAVKAYRKRANGGMGFTQQQLGEKIGCGKDTVSRWERGKASRVRTHLRDPLCKALGVEWDTLTRPSEPEPNRMLQSVRTQKTWWVAKQVPAALTLVANRYGIRPVDVLDLAPLLFVTAAERSLLARRQRLDEIWAMRQEAEGRLEDRSEHLGPLVGSFDITGENTLLKEKESLGERDIAGRLVERGDWEWEEHGEDGPFVRYIRAQAEGLPKDAVSIESGFGVYMDYRVAVDTLNELTGNFADESEGDKLAEKIWEGYVDLNECIKARRDHDGDRYRRWVHDALVKAEEAYWRDCGEVAGEALGEDGGTALSSGIQEGRVQ